VKLCEKILKRRYIEARRKEEMPVKNDILANFNNFSLFVFSLKRKNKKDNSHPKAEMKMKNLPIIITSV
jgi:hypothetical protein